jgi:short-subunit dehydrogenase involved in D-alanine esterification of teichoic acids
MVNKCEQGGGGVAALSIGKALAVKFVKLGVHVIINGRSKANVTKAIQGTHTSFPIYCSAVFV